MKPLLIVGIDPGVTVGYALLDINGNVIKLYSSKELDLDKLISKIIEIMKEKEKLPTSPSNEIGGIISWEIRGLHRRINKKDDTKGIMYVMSENGVIIIETSKRIFDFKLTKGTTFHIIYPSTGDHRIEIFLSGNKVK